MLVLSILGTVGCTATHKSNPKIDCAVPALPDLPRIPQEKLLSLDDVTYWSLQERELLLVDWALNMESTMKIICAE